MSLKRRLEYQCRLLRNFVGVWSLPEWATGKTVRVILVFLFLLASVAYVFKTSSLSTSGYKIQKLEREIASLGAEEQKLEIEKARLQSITNIQKRLTEIKMVAAPGIKYLNLQAPAVAKR